MQFRSLTLAALIGAATVLPAFAQSADAQKLALAQKIVVLWKPETMVVGMLQSPAMRTLQQSNGWLQGHVTKETQETTMKAIQIDVQGFIDSVTPMAVESAKKGDTEVVVPMLVKSFSVEELQQILAMLQSPVREKFNAFMPQAEEALDKHVRGDVGPKIDAKIKTLTESVGSKLRAVGTTK